MSFRQSCVAQLAVVAIAVTLSAGCQPRNVGVGRPAFEGTPPLKIVCTTQQVADAVSHIAGSHAEVEALMGPGVDPHIYKAKPSDLLKLQEADMVFYNGLHLEGQVANALERLGERKPVVPFAGKLEENNDARLITPPNTVGVYDPHLWNDVRLWADCVDYAAERLCEFDGERAEDYRANAKAYREELEQLDDEVRTAIESIPADRRLLVTAHDAFGYFSKAYGIETIGLKGISTEDEADFAHLDQVREILVERQVPAVFVESSTSPRLVNKLIEECAAAGHQVHVGHELYSDAMGPADSGAETYTGMVRANVSTIVEGLKGE